MISFDHVKTRNRVQQRDDLAKDIAEREGITEGIVCLISAVEPCMSSRVGRNHDPSCPPRSQTVLRQTTEMASETPTRMADDRTDFR